MATLQRPGSKDEYLVTVLSVSFVLGMAVAIGIYSVLAIRGIAARAFLNALSVLTSCLSAVHPVRCGRSAPDSGLALALTVGTIVFANAFLYAGVAAGGYTLW